MSPIRTPARSEPRTSLTPTTWFGAVGWALGAQIIATIFGIATNVVIARGLGPAGQGLVAVAILVPTFLALIFGGGLSAANGYFAGGGRISLERLTGNSVTVAIIGLISSGLVVGALWRSGLLERALPGVAALPVVIAVITLPILLLRQSTNGIVLGLQNVAQASRADIAHATSYLIGAIVFTLLLGWGVSGGVLAYLGALVFGLVVSGLWLWRRGARFLPIVDTGVMRRTISFGYRGGAGIILQFFTYRLDLILVNGLVGAAAAGHYAISSRLAELLWILPGAVGTAVFSRSAATGDARMNSVTPRAFWLTLTAGLVMALAMAVLGPILIPAVFSEAYRASYVPMAIILPGALLLGSSAVLANDLVGRGHPGLVSLAAALAFAITVGLDLALIPRFDTIGAATASAVAYTAYGLFVIVIYLRVTGLGWIAFMRAATRPILASAR